MSRSIPNIRKLNQIEIKIKEFQKVFHFTKTFRAIIINQAVYMYSRYLGTPPFPNEKLRLC